MDQKENKVFILEKDRAPEWVPISKFIERSNGEILVFKPKEPIRGPRLWAPAYTIDFGDFHAKSGEKRTITVLNIGSEPLMLQKAQFSCDCATVEFSPKKIEPHGFSRINLTFDTSGKPNGKFTLRMFLFTNEKKKSPHEFVLNGNVIRPKMSHKGPTIGEAKVSLGSIDLNMPIDAITKKTTPPAAKEKK